MWCNYNMNLENCPNNANNIGHILERNVFTYSETRKLFNQWDKFLICELHHMVYCRAQRCYDFYNLQLLCQVLNLAVQCVSACIQHALQWFGCVWLIYTISIIKGTLYKCLYMYILLCVTNKCLCIYTSVLVLITTVFCYHTYFQIICFQPCVIYEQKTWKKSSALGCINLLCA